MRRRYKYKQNRRLYTFLFIVFLLACISFIVLFETRIRPVINQVAEAKGKSVAESIINDEVNKLIISKSMSYGDLVHLQKDTSGKISAVTSNIVEMNRLKSELAINIQKRLQAVDEMQASIPLGTLISSGYFIGYGPKVKIQLTPIGYAGVNVEDSFKEAGINQTRHEIHLIVHASVRILLPISSIVADVNTDIPLSQAVIIGDVPENFTSVAGVNGEPQDNILNMLN